MKTMILSITSILLFTALLVSTTTANDYQKNNYNNDNYHNYNEDFPSLSLSSENFRLNSRTRRQGVKGQESKFSGDANAASLAGITRPGVRPLPSRGPATPSGGHFSGPQSSSSSGAFAGQFPVSNGGSGSPSAGNDGHFSGQQPDGFSPESNAAGSSAGNSRASSGEQSGQYWQGGDDSDNADAEPPSYGGVQGTPGVDFPNYSQIPITGFSCAGVPYEPGMYADEETQCQVYHVCFQGRKESFLCGIGTVFNQAILACDYWHSVECGRSKEFYSVNEELGKASPEQGQGGSAEQKWQPSQPQREEQPQFGPGSGPKGSSESGARPYEPSFEQSEPTGLSHGSPGQLGPIGPSGPSGPSGPTRLSGPSFGPGKTASRPDAGHQGSFAPSGRPSGPSFGPGKTASRPDAGHQGSFAPSGRPSGPSFGPGKTASRPDAGHQGSFAPSGRPSGPSFGPGKTASKPDIGHQGSFAPSGRPSGPSFGPEKTASRSDFGHQGSFAPSGRPSGPSFGPEKTASRPDIGHQGSFALSSRPSGPSFGPEKTANRPDIGHQGSFAPSSRPSGPSFGPEKTASRPDIGHQGSFAPSGRPSGPSFGPEKTAGRQSGQSGFLKGSRGPSHRPQSPVNGFGSGASQIKNGQGEDNIEVESGNFQVQPQHSSRAGGAPSWSSQMDSSAVPEMNIQPSIRGQAGRHEIPPPVLAPAPSSANFIPQSKQVKSPFSGTGPETHSNQMSPSNRGRFQPLGQAIGPLEPSRVAGHVPEAPKEEHGPSGFAGSNSGSRAFGQTQQGFDDTQQKVGY